MAAAITLGANVENLDAHYVTSGTGSLNLVGNALDNMIMGTSGRDVITGGAGTDSITGGAGNDLYIIAAAADHTTTEGIMDTSGTDEIRFTSTVASTLTLSQYIIDVESVTIGTGTGVSALVTATTALNVDAHALTYGVVITGNAGNNVLTGSDYADTLNGGLGNDTLIGGLGNDTYIVDSLTDTITEGAGSGNDTVRSSVTYSLASIANVENLVLTGSSAINGTGNTLDNTITGNSAANTLDGGAGNDTLIGGLGNDTLDGSTGQDTYVFSGLTFDANGTDTITFVLADDTLQFNLGAVNAATGASLTAGTIGTDNIVVGANAEALDANDYFLYDTVSGQLSFDADGNGGEAEAELLAVLVGAPSITAVHVVLAAG